MIRVERELTVIGWGAPSDHCSVLDPYFPQVWTSRLGPTSVCAVQLLTARLYDHGAWHESFTIEPVELACQLGLARSVSKLQHTLDRLARFGFAEVNDHVVGIRVTCPRISRAHLNRFAPLSVEAHERHMARERQREARAS